MWLGQIVGDATPALWALSRVPLEKPKRVQLAEGKCGWLALSSIAWKEPEEVVEAALELHDSACVCVPVFHL